MKKIITSCRDHRRLYGVVRPRVASNGCRQGSTRRGRYRRNARRRSRINAGIGNRIRCAGSRADDTGREIKAV